MDRLTKNVYYCPLKEGLDGILTKESPTHTIHENTRGTFDETDAVDLVGKEGLPVYSAYQKGKVVRVHKGVNKNYENLDNKEGAIYELGEENLSGNFVVIEHETSDGKKEYSFYGHLKEVNVNVGDEIGLESVIGTLGNTGWSKGPHVHHWVFRREGNTRLSLIIRLVYQGKETTYDNIKSRFSNPYN
ncbi:M23 family metallopeptidase [Candidatus Woesearchaeota archaeon]|nr:M23 family metallopeptidase [Candidatus Woesearchaeota archaeon]